MDNDCAKEIHDKLSKLSKLHGRYAALEEKVRGIEKMNDERYQGLTTKTQNMINLYETKFNGLNCRDNEKQLTKAIIGVESFTNQRKEGTKILFTGVATAAAMVIAAFLIFQFGLK